MISSHFIGTLISTVSFFFIHKKFWARTLRFGSTSNTTSRIFLVVINAQRIIDIEEEIRVAGDNYVTDLHANLKM